MVYEPIVIKQKTVGNLIYIVGAAAMSLISLALVFVDFRSAGGALQFFTQNDIMNFLFKGILVVGFLFFGYCGIFCIKRIKSAKDILIVDDNGITDNSSALSFGFMPWSDIDRVYVDGMLGNDFIEVVLKDEKKYINKVKWLARQAVLINKKMGHQIVCITLNSTGISPRQLLVKIQKMHKQSKNQ